MNRERFQDLRRNGVTEKGNEREKEEDEARGILVFSHLSDESRGIFVHSRHY